MLRKLLVLFGSTRGTLAKRLKAIATERKRNYPRSLWFKPDGSIDFRQNWLNRVFKDGVRKKKFWKGRAGFFNLAEELKSFIALNILSPNYRVLGVEKKFCFLKDNLFGIHWVTDSKVMYEVYLAVVKHLAS